eukprot:7693247-Pyramimonas_sp.AAC.1
MFNRDSWDAAGLPGRPHGFQELRNLPGAESGPRPPPNAGDADGAEPGDLWGAASAVLRDMDLAPLQPVGRRSGALFDLSKTIDERFEGRVRQQKGLIGRPAVNAASLAPHGFEGAPELVDP